MDHVNCYLRHHDQSVNAVREIIAVFLENYTLRGKSDGLYRYDCDLKIYRAFLRRKSMINGNVRVKEFQTGIALRQGHLCSSRNVSTDQPGVTAASYFTGCET